MYSSMTSLVRMRPSNTSVDSISHSTMSCWRLSGCRTRNTTTSRANIKFKMWNQLLNRNESEVAKWVLTSRASNRPNQGLQAHPWCHKLLRVVSTRTHPLARCSRCKASTRQASIKTRLFPRTLPTTLRITTKLDMYHNNSKMRKESRAMLMISMVMAKQSIRVDMISRFQTTKSSKLLDV